MNERQINEMQIELQLPALHHKMAAEDFKNDFFENNETFIFGSAKFHSMEYEPWLEYTKSNRQESTVSKEDVVKTTYFAVRKCDEKIIGIIDIRHSLGDGSTAYSQYLLNFGGHIGLSVRPSERNKGYSTELLRMGLEYAKTLNIKKVMVGCYSDNPQSIRTIENCGGIFSEKKPYTDGKPVNIYFIFV